MRAEQHLGARRFQREVESECWLSLEFRRVDQRRGESGESSEEIGADFLREIDVGEWRCEGVEGCWVGEGWTGWGAHLWREY